MVFSAWELTVALLAPSEGAIEFRCDAMQVNTSPNRSICENNVVLRRGNLLLCCNRLEGEADAQWNWQRYECKGDVRSLRNNELTWSDFSEYLFATNDLIMTGNPFLRQGTSLLAG